MMDGMVTPAVTAFFIGIGCGTCCSPFVNAFLSAYIVSHGDGVKGSFGTFIRFFSGKLLGVSVLCLTASVIGKQLISDHGYIGNFPFRLAVQIMISLFGFLMSVHWIWEIKKGTAECGHCKKCGKEELPERKHYSMLAVGILYGITPCPPLLFVFGYSVSLPVFTAGITGISFSLASILSPLLMLAAVLGILSKRSQAEIPGFLKWFRLASYMLLMVLPFTLERI